MIRLATLEDLDMVYSELRDTGTSFVENRTIEWCSERISNGDIVLFLMDGSPVGLVVFEKGVVYDDDNFDNDMVSIIGSTPRLLNLWVFRDFRDSQIGHEFLDLITSYCDFWILVPNNTPSLYSLHKSKLKYYGVLVEDDVLKSFFSNH